MDAKSRTGVAVSGDTGTAPYVETVSGDEQPVPVVSHPGAVGKSKAMNHGTHGIHGRKTRARGLGVELLPCGPWWKGFYPLSILWYGFRCLKYFRVVRVFRGDEEVDIRILS